MRLFRVFAEQVNRGNQKSKNALGLDSQNDETLLLRKHPMAAPRRGDITTGSVPERRIASARGRRSYNSGERTSQVRQPNGAARSGKYNKACEASS